MAPKTHINLVKIGVISSTSGLSVQTLRYYQTRGLIQPKQISDSGYRLYDPAISQRISFILHSKSIGFSLEEILELLVLQDNPSIGAFQVKKKIEEKITAIDEKIKKLTHIKLSLTTLASDCSGKGVIADCPIIAKLRS